MNSSQNNILIESQQLTKKLTNSHAETLLILDRIDLCIKRGESVAITGTSGSGKTTLLGLLAGLDSPSEGEVLLLGKPLSQLDEDQRASLRLGKIGFVFQSFHLMDNLTAVENVMLPLELDPQDNTDFKQRQQRAIAALTQVGLQDRVEHLPTQLSGGEQQRVALARAFVSQPQILFADEPTGNLDKQTSNEIIALLFSMQQHYQTTLVMVTHDEQLATQCQIHYRLDQAQLVQINHD